MRPIRPHGGVEATTTAAAAAAEAAAAAIIGGCAGVASPQRGPDALTIKPPNTKRHVRKLFADTTVLLASTWTYAG